MKKPVAFIIFNRPDITEVIFKEIRKYAPEQLFVIADGPRFGKENEVQLCQQTRDVIKVDWSCEVKFIYSNENLGCQQRIYTGLNEVFDSVEEAIILEDDCLPHEDFFKYCEELLGFYKDNDQIMAISGNNFKEIDEYKDISYHYTDYFICWGWATWKNSWDKMDINMEYWKSEKVFNEKFKDPIEREYWEDIYKKTKSKKVNSWYYPWLFSIWANKGYSIAPRVNLVSNIGFGENSTHTGMKGMIGDNTPFYGIEEILTKETRYYPENDRYVVEEFYGIRNLKEKVLINSQKCKLYELIFEEAISFDSKKIMIFGTGKLALNIFKQVKALNIIGFIDSNSNKWGDFIDCIKIYNIDEINNFSFDTILVTIEGNHDTEIIKNLTFLFPDKEILSWKQLCR